MSHFRDLLRQSKVVSLPSARLSTGSKDIPQSQVLKTTSAAHFRRNWGIKGNLPSKAKSTLVTFQKLENERGFPELEYGAPTTRRTAMFRELGVPVDLRGQVEFSSLLSAGPRPPKTLASVGERQKKKLIKQLGDRGLEFKEYLRENGRSPTANTSTLGKMEKFLGYTPSIFGNNQQTQHTPIGLSYALKGVLHNTRDDGLVRTHDTQGRVLPRGSAQRVAVAGFCGRMNTRPYVPESAVTHERPIPVVVDRATSDPQGRISLSLIPAQSVRERRLKYVDELSHTIDKLIT